MDMLLILLIIIAACFVAVLAIGFRGDARVSVAAAIGLLLTLILIFNPA